MVGVGGLALSDGKRQMSSGFFAYVGARQINSEAVCDGFAELRNFGYDYAEVASLRGDNQVIVSQFEKGLGDPVDLACESASVEHRSSTLWVAHTTTGSNKHSTFANAYPESDSLGRFMVFHTGYISNRDEICDFLSKSQVTLNSTSDSELIAKLVEVYIATGLSPLDALKEAVSNLHGSFAVVMVDKEHPTKLYTARNGHPLLIGLSDNGYYISSDALAFVKYSKKLVSLHDNSVHCFDSTQEIADGLYVEAIEDDVGEISLGSYAHWTLKEIEEQSVSVARALNFGARLTHDSAVLKGLEDAKESLMTVKNLVITGCGSSLHAAQFGQAMFRSLGLMNTVSAVNASQLTKQDLPNDAPGVIAISQSGERADLNAAIAEVVRLNVPCISLVNTQGSTLSRLTQAGAYLNAGREHSESATKSFMNACVVLTEVALWLSKELHPEDTLRRQDIVKQLHRLSMTAGSTIAQTKRGVMDLAHEIAGCDRILILGKGPGEAIAHEGAQAFKQISKVHAEAYAGSALKHGPFALIENDTPIILLVFDDEFSKDMNLALEQVKGRNAKTIVITNNPSLINQAKADYIIRVEDNGELTPLLGVIPLQLLAYYLSLSRGQDPDSV
jgi:glucosamine--fructose-6-phosphate aminotransferase (isomerizing)